MFHGPFVSSCGSWLQIEQQEDNKPKFHISWLIDDPTVLNIQFYDCSPNQIYVCSLEITSASVHLYDSNADERVYDYVIDSNMKIDFNDQ